MIMDEFLPLLECVRPTSTGWVARCPAHDDRRPSLSIHDGDRGVLLRCWASCTPNEIAVAMGITMRDLFYDADPDPRARRTPHTTPWRCHWRRTAADLEDHALTLWLRAESVLAFATDMQTRAWTDDDFERAVQSVSQAYADRERGTFLEDVACRLRMDGLTKEHAYYASRRRGT